MNRLFWWHMFAGTRGGYTRGFILNLLTEKPYNASQLAQGLNIDYETTRYHLDVLAKNGVITFGGDKYDKTFFPSNALEANLKEFNKIWEKIETNAKQDG